MVRSVLGLASIGVVVAAGLLLSACGGGGGGGDGANPNALLQGTYRYLWVQCDVSGDAVSSEIGTFDAVGDGVVTFRGSYLAREGTASSGVRPAGTYSVAADRSMALTDHLGTPLVGRVNASGRFAALATRTAGSDPALVALCLQEPTPTLGLLAGEWTLVHFARTSATLGDTTAGYSRVTVDADGRIHQSDWTYNRDGEINPVPVAFIATRFALDGPGGVRMETDPVGAVIMRGGLSADHDLVLLGGVVSQANAWALVRQHAAGGNADLSGTYTLSGFDNPGTPYQSIWGEGTFDGVGAGTFTVNGNREGALVGPFAFTQVYGVSVASMVSTILTPANQFVGGLSFDHTYLVLGGGFAPGSGPAVHVLVR
jgi:hypothetical protein